MAARILGRTNITVIFWVTLLGYFHVGYNFNSAVESLDTVLEFS